MRDHQSDLKCALLRKDTPAVAHELTPYVIYCRPRCKDCAYTVQGGDPAVRVCTCESIFGTPLMPHTKPSKYSLITVPTTVDMNHNTTFTNKTTNTTMHRGPWNLAYMVLSQ